MTGLVLFVAGGVALQRFISRLWESLEASVYDDEYDGAMSTPYDYNETRRWRS